MAVLPLLRLIWLLFIAYQTIACGSQKFSPQWCEALTPRYSNFEQHVADFWAYDRSANTWSRIDISEFLRTETGSERQGDELGAGTGIQEAPDSYQLAPYWGRVSLMKFSEVSIWSTGHSGSIYERFWNGVQWVIIPHDLPNSAGYATSVYSVNRTMLALSEAGKLYQLQVDTNGQLQWVTSGPWEPSKNPSDSSSIILKKSAVLSNDGSSLFFSTSDGWLAELCSVHPVRWTNHNHPRGGDVAIVADAGSLKGGVIFTVSTNGDLYEYDANSKPAWRKHIRTGSPIERHELAPVSGIPVHDLAGVRSFSLFLMTKNGFLVERRLAQAKWRWVLHTRPDARLSLSLGPMLTEKDGKMANISLFLVSEHGAVYEYKLPFLHGNMRSTSLALQNGTWTNHNRPRDAAVMASLPGVVLNGERILFPLEDGRLGELHVEGLGGPAFGPISRSSSIARKHHPGYVWSIFDAPESEGGNADYCSTVLGPSNCLEGLKDAHGYLGDYSEMQDKFSASGESSWPWAGTVDSLFRARTLQFGKSIFLVGQDGVPSERFFNGKVWLWLKHDFSAQIRGILGVYNGSVFMNDIDGNLLVREWNGNMLEWLNCSALEGGSRVTSGSPWDGMLGEVRTVTLEDAQFFVSESGELLEFLVALRNFRWLNCGHPAGTSVAAIVDQEVLRYRVIFVIGSDGKLYHFNRITRNWYSYQQPSELRLSTIPGAVYRPSFQTTSGSLFLRSENGNLVEFRWDPARGWIWSDHNYPARGTYIATSPGPYMENGSILVVASDGRVYARQLIDGKWNWQDLGHPLHEAIRETGADGKTVYIVEERSKEGPVDVFVSFEGECDARVDSVRPVALSRNIAVFILRDGRLAELKQEEDKWEWVSIVDTPTASCQSSYWTALGSS